MESLPRSRRERRRLLLNETPEQRAARLEAQRLAAEEAERVVHAKRAAARERRLAKKREAHRLRRERERAGIIAKAAKKKAAKKKAVAKSALDRKRERWAKRKAAMASAEAVAERARKAAERAERMEEARLAREVAAANRRMMVATPAASQPIPECPRERELFQALQRDAILWRSRIDPGMPVDPRLYVHGAGGVDAGPYRNSDGSEVTAFDDEGGE